MRLISRLLRVTRFRRVVALISALKSCFGPPAETVGLVRYWRQKASPGPPVATRERANYNSICPYGFRYHQPRRFSARARRARPIAAAFCFVITSILPPSFSPHPLSFLRGGISNFCRILLVSTFSALDIIDIVRTACVTRGASEAFRKKFLSPRGNFSLPLSFFYADSSANYEILPRYPIARCGVNKDARTRGWKFMRRAEFRGNAR